MLKGLIAIPGIFASAVFAQSAPATVKPEVKADTKKAETVAAV